jgi:hypothetical protein
MMIVLAIISLSVAMVMPRMGAALDQVVVHTLQFEMQRQVSTLRRLGPGPRLYRALPCAGGHAASGGWA